MLQEGRNKARHSDNNFTIVTYIIKSKGQSFLRIDIFPKVQKETER